MSGLIEIDSILWETIEACSSYRLYMAKEDKSDYYFDSYKSRAPAGIIGYFQSWLEGGLSTPDDCPFGVEVGYSEDTQTLVANIALPRWESVNHAAPRKGDRAGDVWYANTLIELVLGALYQIFYWDDEHAIREAIVNGFLEDTESDPLYLLSIHTTPEVFHPLAVTRRDGLSLLENLESRFTIDPIGLNGIEPIAKAEDAEFQADNF